MPDDCRPGRAFPDWSSADSGDPDPGLASASSRAALLAAFVDARVFAAVSATSTAEEVTEHGLRAESTADMAVLLVEAGDERALPVFSSLTQLQRWRPSARPVPLTGRDACRAALDEGAAAVVLDPGDRPVVLGTEEVTSLAAGFVPVPGSSVASRVGTVELTEPRADVPEALPDALRAALRPERLRQARLLEGPDGLVLGVVPHRPLRAEELAALGQRVVRRLGDALPATGLDLVQVPARGVGTPLLRSSWFRRGR